MIQPAAISHNAPALPPLPPVPAPQLSHLSYSTQPYSGNPYGTSTAPPISHQHQNQSFSNHDEEYTSFHGDNEGHNPNDEDDLVGV